MNFYDIIYRIAHEKGVSIIDLATSIGRSRTYIMIQKSRGSLPIVSTASTLANALGYKLCLVPEDDVPDGAYVIE